MTKVIVTQADLEAASVFFPEHLWKQEARDDIAQAFAQHRAQTDIHYRDLLNLAYTYLSDLKRPPTGDSLQRRIEQAERVIARAGGT